MKKKRIGSQNQGCSTCKIPCKRASLLLSQFWRIQERPCMKLNKIFVENVLLVAGILQPRSNSYAVGYSHVWKAKFHERKQGCVQYKSASKSLVFKNLVG